MCTSLISFPLATPSANEARKALFSKNFIVKLATFCNSRSVDARMLSLKIDILCIWVEDEGVEGSKWGLNGSTVTVEYTIEVLVRKKRKNSGWAVVSVGSVNERCEKNFKCVSPNHVTLERSIIEMPHASVFSNWSVRWSVERSPGMKKIVCARRMPSTEQYRSYARNLRLFLRECSPGKRSSLKCIFGEQTWIPEFQNPSYIIE